MYALGILLFTIFAHCGGMLTDACAYVNLVRYLSAAFAII
jgi:hypothetical protein